MTTADHYYYMEEKIVSAERAGKLLPTIMRMVDKDVAENLKEKNGSDNENEEIFDEYKQNESREFDKLCQSQSASTSVPKPLSLAAESFEAKIKRFLLSKEADSSNDANEPKKSIQDTASSSSSNIPRKFSVQDTVRVLRVFGQLIENNTSGMVKLKEIIRTNEEAKYLVKKYSINSVQNRIKYEIKARKK